MTWDKTAFDRWLTTDPVNQAEVPECVHYGVECELPCVCQCTDCHDTADEYDPYDAECVHPNYTCPNPDSCRCGCVECEEARSDV